MKQPTRRREPIPCDICRADVYGPLPAESQVWHPCMGRCDRHFMESWRKFARAMGWI